MIRKGQTGELEELGGAIVDNYRLPIRGRKPQSQHHSTRTVMFGTDGEQRIYLHCNKERFGMEDEETETFLAEKSMKHLKYNR